MGAILEATELILDEVNELFSYGWHERGTQLRNDGHRAAFLNHATREFCDLSTNSVTHLRYGGLFTQPRNNTNIISMIKIISELSLEGWEDLASDHQT